MAFVICFVELHYKSPGTCFGLTRAKRHNSARSAEHPVGKG